MADASTSPSREDQLGTHPVIGFNFALVVGAAGPDQPVVRDASAELQALEEAELSSESREGRTAGLDQLIAGRPQYGPKAVRASSTQTLSSSRSAMNRRNLQISLACSVLNTPKRVRKTGTCHICSAQVLRDLLC